MEFLKRTWAEIDIDCVRHNFNVIKSAAAGRAIMAVVKADAYGHGVSVLAPIYDKLGVDSFAVSNIGEAVYLRTIGIIKDILILGHTPPHLAKVLCENNLIQTVFDKDFATELSNAAQTSSCSVRVHIKIDTGMGRIGFACRNQSEIEKTYSDLLLTSNLCGLVVEGAFMHFACADRDGDENGEFTKEQSQLFFNVCRRLKADGIDLKNLHCSNSSHLLLDNCNQGNIVRAGIVLYGLTPSTNCNFPAQLRPVMTFKTTISMIKTLSVGESVCYGRTYICKKPTLCATISAGYADGYSRHLSNCGFVSINGTRAPIIGRVCMDQTVVDISHIPNVNVNDEVILFGDGIISCDDIASQLGTINYEIACNVSKRVPRVFVENNKIIEIIDYFPVD